ncbi:DUF5816 domain-containing protein [Halocalculus aciditolerans]|uniref:GNAT family acetyltransferase n=1 Tax=Halocalculus aciditolerans TaxID=1383812 RepID=A0A830F1N2_9EURY|nr:DUF5816 domain-containing protein [Halocalculus aciditolerans]GGL52988.1 hypothetical protein GCM10009039_08980 [Halocalculus aciditolerans]
MEARELDDGTTVYVSDDEVERGQNGAFKATYKDPDADERWGWFCANCETFDNAMDSMGRIQCNVCGNLRKPDEWDAAHE